jgi:hypothetical protein
MTQADLIVAAIDALNEAEVPYLLAGSVATNAYSIPLTSSPLNFRWRNLPDRLLSAHSRLRW